MFHGGRKAGQSNDIDDISRRFGGHVDLRADIAAISDAQRADGMVILDLSNDPPLLWSFKAGASDAEGDGVIAPKVAGHLPGRWFAAGAFSPGAILQNGNSFNDDVRVGSIGPYQLQIKTNNITRVSVTAVGDVGIGISPRAKLHVAGAVIFGSLDIGDLPTGGPVGAAAATVDVSSCLCVNQQTAGQTISLPNPTEVMTGRICIVQNVGAQAFTMLGVTVAAGNGSIFASWNGSAWTRAL